MKPRSLPPNNRLKLTAHMTNFLSARSSACALGGLIREYKK